MTDDWISTAAAAELLGVTRQQVHRLIAAGTLAARPLGARFTVVDRRALERYARTRRPAGRPPNRVLSGT